MKLVDALLKGSAGPQIRTILRLRSEAIYTELLYVRLRRVAEGKSSCDVRACIAKWEADGGLAQDAVEVVFRCLDVTVLDWHSSFYRLADIPRLEPAEDEIDIDTEDCFRVLCRAIEVLSVQADKLGACSEETKTPNQSPEPTAMSVTPPAAQEARQP